MPTSAVARGIQKPETTRVNFPTTTQPLKHVHMDGNSKSPSKMEMQIEYTLMSNTLPLSLTMSIFVKSVYAPRAGSAEGKEGAKGVGKGGGGCAQPCAHRRRTKQGGSPMTQRTARSLPMKVRATMVASERVV